MARRRRFHVYVYETSGGSLNVGQTALRPRDRIQEHRVGKAYCEAACHMAPKDVASWWIVGSYDTREEAEEAERREARKFRRQGFKVLGGR